MRAASGAAAIAALALAACAAPRTATEAPAVARSTAATTATAPPGAPTRCADDAGWNDPATPRRIHGDTWYVGTCGITALLVTSAAGHVLLDSGTEQAAPQVLANIRALGVRVEDIRYIATSHAHHDHVGGVAALQRASGATVVALDGALPALRTGRSAPGDPQHGDLSPFAPIAALRPIADGGRLRVGTIALTAHATPGHAPGGTSWTWRSCQGGTCIDIAYVDSLTAVGARGYRFADPTNAPVLAALRATFDRVAALPCDLLLTPHPQASALWSRLGPGATQPLVSPGACRDLADASRHRLEARLAEENANP